MSYNEPQRRDGAGSDPGALQAARFRRNRLIVILSLVVVVAIVAVVAVWAFNSGDDEKAGGFAATSSHAPTATEEPAGKGGEEPTAADDALAPTYQPTATSLEGVNAPQGARSDGGIPVGKDGKAGTDNGAGAVVVDVYFDYMCPMCSYFDDINRTGLDDLREGGNITQVFHPVAILDSQSMGTMYSTRAASAAAYVADKAPDEFDAFHELLFANQPDEGTKGLSDKRIQELAEQVGVPKDVAAGIGDGTAVTEFGDWVQAATYTAANTEALKFEYDGEMAFGTPTVVINGQRLEGDWRTADVLQQAIAGAKK